jgi:3',5'-cyclic AMP phosphodiesterase CpdA
MAEEPRGGRDVTRHARAVVALIAGLIVLNMVVVNVDDSPAEAATRRVRRTTAQRATPARTTIAPVPAVASASSITTTRSVTPSPATTEPSSWKPTVVAAAGDLACRSGAMTIADQCHHQEVSEAIVLDRAVDAFLALGDLQYDNGESGGYADAYRNSFGRLRTVTYPVPGNHDWNTPGAAGYHGFFGVRAGEPGKGWYAVDLNPAWQLVALNTNCAIVRCGAGSEQEVWLRRVLAASSAPCTIAITHHPRFSSGSTHGDNPTVAPLWAALDDALADVVLAGHEHNYERFAPRRATGELGGGPVSFVVGTGGRSFYGFAAPKPGSEARVSGRFGYLRMMLGDRRFTYEFVAEGGSVIDSGSGTCR